MIRYILAATLIATPIAAQDAPEQCGQSSVVYDTLTTQFGEKMLVTGHAENGAALEFWLNPLQPSWTLIVTTDGMSCLLADGKDWTFDVPKQGSDM